MPAKTGCHYIMQNGGRLPHNGRSFFEVKEQVKGKEITMDDICYQKSDSNLERTVNS